MLTGLLGYNALANHNRMSELNKEAENQWVRKNVFHHEGKGIEDDDMSPINILGDINHPHSHSQTSSTSPHQPPQQQRSGISPLAAAILGAAIPGAGIGGVLLDRFLNPPTDQPAPIVEDYKDLGIGIIEDYLTR